MKKEDDDSVSVITKDKAYVAAAKVIEHFKKIRGVKNTKYLEKYFKRTWDEIDKDEKNFMSVENSIQFMHTLIDADD